MESKFMTNFRKKQVYKDMKYKWPKTRYLKWRKKLPIDDRKVLLESQHGTEINGNMFYLLKALATDPSYKDYKIYMSCRAGNKARFEAVLDNYGIEGVNLVVVYTKEYLKAIASAKYLFNDNTFLPFFIKRDEQVYLNTWHGTPLKTLGRGIKNALHGIGNAQKNFVCADYLLYPNRYTMEHMVRDYMLEDMAKGKCVLAGYPRNTAFCNKNRGSEIIEELGLQGKRIYAYMPTWRGSVGNQDDKANTYFKYYLYELDKILDDDEIVFLNLHPIGMKNVDFQTFTHIKKFPAEYETYDFLNCAECLITDYSSVFYDYAVTGKKCVLFTFDEEDYFADRGVYRPLSSLPFPKVRDLDSLLAEIRSPKAYDDTEFLKEYCSYDRPEASEKLLDFVFYGKKDDMIEEEEIADNGKKNVLIYVGNLDQNGITTSSMNLLKNLDASENNYIVCFPAEKGKLHQDTIAQFPEGVKYFPIQGFMNLGRIKRSLWLNFHKGRFPFMLIKALLKKEWKLETERMFGGIRVDNAVQFNGYETKMILVFAQFGCDTTIYVHNDMVSEIKMKGNQRKDVLKYAYSKYDNVALVTEDIWKPTATFVHGTKNFKIARNIIDYDEIIRRGGCELQFDEGVTQSNRSLDEIKEILASESKVFVNVGRFSPEKGQRRMIDAFCRVWQENPDMYLVVIGGIQRDGLYDELCEYIKTLPCCDNVILILSMSNPLPIVKACDGFVLASHYEGFGLVLVEADILGVPVVSTDIVGPRTFMQKNNGTLVPDTDKGVEEGFRLLLEGKVSMLTTDYVQYNKEALEEFKALIN